jgi:trans-2,3-dihydro-3-hydroxyanthranilate isomerase
LPDTGLNYALVDVFAERPLEGNQLAIFTDARGLSTAEMQALARETNLAETTFVLPDEPHVEANEGVRVRIFTTQEELPFAGHPTLGTASWLHWTHPLLGGRDSMTLKLNSGPITVRFAPDAHRRGIFGTMTQRDPVFGTIHDRAEVAAVLGVGDGLDPALPVQTVSTGMPFCIVPFRSAEALRGLAIPRAAAQAWLDRAGAKFFYCLAPSAGASGPEAPRFEARMQFYNGEDPATGSAAGCAIAWLVAHGVVASEEPVVFEQGVKIGRPSRLSVRATLLIGAKERKIVGVQVGGRTIPVAIGRFFRA